MVGETENEKVILTGEMSPYLMAGDLGDERINIYDSDVSDAPSLYEIKVIIEYTSYAGEIQKIQSENLKLS